MPSRVQPKPITGYASVKHPHPYAELALRGIKPIEFRSRPTRMIGEVFYVCDKQRKAYEQTESLKM